MIDDDESALHPPSWSRVLARAHVSTVLAVHGEIADSEPTAQAEADGIRAELADSGHAEELEPWEESLLSTPLVQWTRQQVVDASWRYEGAGVLAWWLGRLELPPLDTPVDAGEVVRALTPWEDVLTPAASPRPGRSPEDLDLLSAQLLTAHWRLVDHGINPRSMDLAAFVTNGWFGPLTVDGLPLAGGDLAVGGAPVSDADPAAVELAGSVVRERRLAVAWLAGENELWSEGSLDT